MSKFLTFHYFHMTVHASTQVSLYHKSKYRDRKENENPCVEFKILNVAIILHRQILDFTVVGRSQQHRFHNNWINGRGMSKSFT
jgi:hypothetical protein